MAWEIIDNQKRPNDGSPTGGNAPPRTISSVCEIKINVFAMIRERVA